MDKLLQIIKLTLIVVFNYYEELKFDENTQEFNEASHDTDTSVLLSTIGIVSLLLTVHTMLIGVEFE